MHPVEKTELPPVNPETLDALNAIKTTPYPNSFLSRVRGFQPEPETALIAVDWEIRAPWMDLMRDVVEHHSLMQYVPYNVID